MYEQCSHISSDWADLELHVVSDIIIAIQTLLSLLFSLYVKMYDIAKPGHVKTYLLLLRVCVSNMGKGT